MFYETKQELLMRKFIIFTICLLLIFRCLNWALLSSSGALSILNDDREDIVLPDLLYQSRLEEKKFATKFYTELKFRFDKSNLDPNYQDNQESLDHFEYLMDSIGIDKIQHIEIVIQSSPEGVFEHNVNLTRKRARSIEKFISEEYPMLEGRVVITKVGESWGLLCEYVKGDLKLSDQSKEKIINVIESDVNPGTKKWRMENTLGSDAAVGDIYKYLLAKYYPLIRVSGFYISLNPFPELSEEDFCGLIRPETTIPDSIFIREIPVKSELKVDVPEDISPAQENSFDIVTVVALKTNLLFDAVSAFNAEIEIPIGKHFSVSLSDVFPWWEKDNKYCFEVLTIGPEIRYYLKAADDREKKLRGHFVGAYAFSGKYDLQNDSRLCYQGDGWSTGLTYGYSTPIGKNEIFNLEMSLSVGMAKINYQHYYPSSDYDRLVRDPNKAGQMTYFGPTGLKISLVKPITIQKKRKSTIDNAVNRYWKADRNR